MNVRDKSGETGLHKATLNGALKVLLCETLLQLGTDVDSKTNNGDSVLMFAVRMGRLDLVK